MRISLGFPRHLVSVALICVAAQAAADPVPGMGTWESTLQARDLNADGVIDAYYDSASNLTWLADANAIHTSGWTTPPGGMPQPDALGRVTYFAANYWAATLNVAGVTGWRLPTLTVDTVCVPASPHWICNPGVSPGSSELENLFKQTLGDTGGAQFNTGPFSNVQLGAYWTGTADPNVSSSPPIYTYNDSSLVHYAYSQYTSTIYAWAVHDGDLAAPVPEPTTALMLFAGLGLITAVVGTRRRS